MRACALETTWQRRWRGWVTQHQQDLQPLARRQDDRATSEGEKRALEGQPDARSVPWAPWARTPGVTTVRVRMEESRTADGQHTFDMYNTLSKHQRLAHLAPMLCQSAATGNRGRLQHRCLLLRHARTKLRRCSQPRRPLGALLTRATLTDPPCATGQRSLGRVRHVG